VNVRRDPLTAANAWKVRAAPIDCFDDVRVLVDESGDRVGAGAGA
jgi:hypothetical protein